MAIRFGVFALVLSNVTTLPVRAEERASKCSTHCAVELVNGCCPARPDSSPIPSGGCPNISECLEGCTKGEAASCTREGWLLRHPQPGEDRDDERAIIFYDRGCRLGNGRGCWLGMESERASYAGALNFETAVIADHMACQYGQATACTKLSELHWSDGKYPLYADRACQLGSRDACIMLAKSFSAETGRGFHWGAHWGMGVRATDPNYDYRARTRRACEFADYVPSCIDLAQGDFERLLPLAASALVERQWRLAFDRLDPLCQRGEGTACHALAAMNEQLLERPNKPKLFDPALSPRLYARACELSEAAGCRALGIALIRGRGTAIDPTAAAQILRKACDLLDGEACVVLSQITADPKQASALIREACLKGMRGPTGEIFTNVGLSEYPQPFKCSGVRRDHTKRPTTLRKRAQ